MILENEELRKISALFVLSFKELTLVKDEYLDYKFNIDGKIFVKNDWAVAYILLEDHSIGYACFDFWFEYGKNCGNYWWCKIKG